MTAQTPSPTTLIRGSRRKAALLIAGLAAVLAVGAYSLGAMTGDATPVLAGGGRGAGGGPASGEANGAGGGSAGAGGGYGGRGYAAGSLDRGAGESGDVSLRIAALPVATLTTQEIDGLVWMREEEKLAHDVYVALGETWGSRVFANIASSEATHMAAVKSLLDRYGIADPAAGQPAGVFTNPEIQALYNDLVTRGRASVADAFTVGALIEDLDISDLRERATTTPDIALVYEDLEQGSENHLRAFVRNLGREGVSYTPTYISVDELQSIIGSPTGQGRSG